MTRISVILWVLLGVSVYANELTVKDRLALAILGENGGDKLFYYPTKKIPFTPKRYGYEYEDVFFKSEDGTKLHGWFLPAEVGLRKAKGTIIFSHGNAGSMPHHFGFVYWMIEENYNVFMYDYRGFGRSGGAVSRKGLVEDAVAAFRYVGTRKDVDQERLVSFGHSLGGAKSIAALSEMGEKAPDGLRAVIVDSTFYSYGDMAEWIAGRTGRRMVSDGYDPGEMVKTLHDAELLVIHGTRDRTIPLIQAEKLYEAAPAPKTFFKVVDGGHTNSLNVNKREYRKKLLKWLDARLKMNGG